MEEDRLWSIVKANPADFTAWTALIQEVDKLVLDLKFGLWFVIECTKICNCQSDYLSMHLYEYLHIYIYSWHLLDAYLLLHVYIRF